MNIVIVDADDIVLMQVVVWDYKNFNRIVKVVMNYNDEEGNKGVFVIVGKDVIIL